MRWCTHVTYCTHWNLTALFTSHRTVEKFCLNTIRIDDNDIINLSLRYHSRFFDCLAHPNLSATLATDHMTLKLSSYLLPKFSRVPFTTVLISLISNMVNGTLLNFGKKYEDDLRIIFDQLHLGMDALKQSKNLKCGVYSPYTFRIKILLVADYVLLLIVNIFAMESQW